MNIYNFSCYREYLSHLVNSSKGTTNKVSYSDISEALNMHRSTFSKIMNKDMEMNADSGYLLVQYLNLPIEEARYLGLLLQRAESNLPERHKLLDKSIRQIQRKKVDTYTALNIEEQTFKSETAEFEYFSSPWPSVIHTFLGIAKYQANPSLITGVLGISNKELNRSLTCLKKLKLIHDLGGGKFARTSELFHVKQKDHMVQLQQILLKGVLNSRLSSTPLTERYGLSVSFSADESTYEAIRQKLIATVVELQKDIGAAKSEKAYHLTIDMLRWEDE